MHTVSNGEDLPFVLIISHPLSNSVVVPIPIPTYDVAVVVYLLSRVYREYRLYCYDSYIKEGMDLEE